MKPFQSCIDYLDIDDKDTLAKETANDECFVSNIKKATSIYILVFVQDKVAAYVTNIHLKNKEVSKLTWSSLCSFSLGASRVSLTNLSRVESLSSVNTSIATTT